MESFTEMQLTFDMKSAELAEVQARNESLSQQLDERTNEFEIALTDIDTLNKHAEWLESALTSIQQIASAEPPLVRSLHRREQQNHHSQQYFSCSSGSASGSSPHPLSQELVARPATKKLSSVIPRFENKFFIDTVVGPPVQSSRVQYTTAGVASNMVEIAESRSEACDSDLQSESRRDAVE